MLMVEPAKESGMDTAQQETPEDQKQPPEDYKKPPQDNGKSSTCDPGQIGQLACTAKKYAKQAEVMTEQAVKDLDTYSTQFAEARQKYTDARTAAKAELDAISVILNGLRDDQLKCKPSEEQKECIDEAADKVFGEIEACSDDENGCESPCDDSPGPDPESQTDSTTLAAEIARRRANLATTADRFKILIGEPDGLKTRVAALKADAEKLAKDVTTGGDGDKAVLWFARLVIIEYWAKPEQVWRGFDSVGAFLDCICGLLKCLVSGWATVAILEGRKAELDCEAEAKEKACEQMKKDTLAAILNAYDECWNSKQESDTPAEGKEPTTGSNTSS
jgi:hypothetical protein